MTGTARTESLSSEILSFLTSVRGDVERQVAKLDRYRALQAIEKTIVDFPGLDDLNRSLAEIRERMQRQIEETREVRALRAVEKIMPDLTEVLAFLAERKDASPPRVTHAVVGASADDIVTWSDPAADEAPSANNVWGVIATSTETVEAPEVGLNSAFSPQEMQIEPRLSPEVSDRIDPGDTPAPANDVGSSADSEISPATTMSYGIAQFLSLDEDLQRAPPREEHGVPAQFDAPSSQEGRAA